MKAVGCFYMHGRVRCGGHSCSESSLMHNGRTHKCTQGHNHTYKWAKYACEGSLGTLQEKCVYLFALPFFIPFTQTLAGHSLAPCLSFFLWICTLSQARLILVFMSLAWRAYYYYHYSYYAWEITLGVGGAEAGFSLLQSSDWSDLWFMQIV